MLEGVRVLGGSTGTDTYFPLPKSPFYLREQGGNLDTPERTIQESLYNDCTLRCAHPVK